MKKFFFDVIYSIAYWLLSMCPNMQSQGVAHQLVLTLSLELQEEIRRLMHLSEARKPEILFRNTLKVYARLVDHEQEGGTIILRSATGTEQEFCITKAQASD